MKNDKSIEYQMTRRMFNALLDGRSETQKKENPYSFVMKIINDEFGLRGTVTKIHIYTD